MPTEDEPALSEEEPAVVDEPVEKEDVLLVPEEEQIDDLEEPEPLEDEYGEEE